MLTKLNLRPLGLFILIVQLSAFVGAQQPPSAVAAIPANIRTAQTVFIANGGGGSFETFRHVPFSGGSDRPYIQFYDAVVSWQRLKPVGVPTEADIVLEISWQLDATRLEVPLLGMLRLRVIDPKTNVVLWTIAEHVEGAGRQRNRDKNFDVAMNSVVTRFKALIEQSHRA